MELKTALVTLVDDIRRIINKRSAFLWILLHLSVALDNMASFWITCPIWVREGPCLNGFDPSLWGGYRRWCWAIAIPYLGH